MNPETIDVGLSVRLSSQLCLPSTSKSKTHLWPHAPCPALHSSLSRCPPPGPPPPWKQTGSWWNAGLSWSPSCSSSSPHSNSVILRASQVRGPQWSRSSSTPSRNLICRPFPCTKLPQMHPARRGCGPSAWLAFVQLSAHISLPLIVPVPSRARRLPSPLWMLQKNPPTTFPRRNTWNTAPSAQALDKARLSGQPRHPGKIGDAQSLLGDSVHRALPAWPSWRMGTLRK